MCRLLIVCTFQVTWLCPPARRRASSVLLSLSASLASQQSQGAQPRREQFRGQRACMCALSIRVRALLNRYMHDTNEWLDYRLSVIWRLCWLRAIAQQFGCDLNTSVQENCNPVQLPTRKSWLQASSRQHHDSIDSYSLPRSQKKACFEQEPSVA